MAHDNHNLSAWTLALFAAALWLAFVSAPVSARVSTSPGWQDASWTQEPEGQGGGEEEDEDFDDEDFDDDDFDDDETTEERDLDESPTEDELGYICFRDGTEKRIDPTGAIWLAKMIHGETRGNPTQEDADAMLWALVQRMGIWNFKSWSLRRMVQAYSQPVNPIWTRTGRKCRRYYEPDFEGEIPDRCSETRVNLRERYIAMDWDDVDETARQAVLDFAAGRIDNHIVGAVGWFAPGTWRSRERNGSNDEDNMVFHAEIDGNVYFAMDRNPDTTAWDETEVMVVEADSFCPMILRDSDDEE